MMTTNYEVPFTSQHQKELPRNWQPRSCGIACVKMIMDFWHKQNPDNTTASLKELLGAGLRFGAYIKDVGWSHTGLVRVAKQFGYDGYNRDLADKPAHLALAAIKEELCSRPLLASVKAKFNPDATDGHLVVVTGLDDQYVYLSDPSEKTNAKGTKRIPLKQFLTAYKKRLILIRPFAISKLERIQTSKINLFASYLAMVKGSVGTRMFRHLFLKLGHKNVDVLEDGGPACSVYASSILYLWGLVKDNHAKTEHTLKDMEESGWYKIKRLRTGCVIAWENKFVQRHYPHIGFYIGKNKAISNDSSNTGVPHVHHYTYGTKKHKPNRRIVALYWHKALEN